MDAIAVIDDRREMRETVARRIRLDLEQLGLAWSVLDSAPLPNPEDYAGWVQEHGVCVIVLDENLSDEFDDDAVDNSGHTVASVLRKQKPDLPQFIVTSVAGSHDLDAAAADLEDVIARNTFNANSIKYVQRMVRAGQSFASRYEAELDQLNRIAMAVINNEASAADLTQANAIREKLQIAFDLEASKNMSDWLGRADQTVAALKVAIEQLQVAQNQNTKK